MPRPAAPSQPSYCLHKRSGRAYVTLGGKQVWLGVYDAPESRDAYDRAIGEWLVNGRTTAAVASGAPELGATVSSVLAAWWMYAEAYYAPPPREAKQRPRGELGNFWDLIKPLRRLYGPTVAAAFGPRALKAVREAYIALGWNRRTVNKQVSRLKMIFKWAVAEELIPASVHHGLSAVGGLKIGRSNAPESEPIRPVDAAHFEATIPHLSRHVRAMVETQLLTGMRPGEMVSMRAGDVDRSGDVWTYAPEKHKTAHHGHARSIRIGPKAQAVLLPFIEGKEDGAAVFSPIESEAERRHAMHAARKTPMSCGNRPGTNRAKCPRRRPRDFYTVASYRRAIARACDVADEWTKGGMVIANDERAVPSWHPHQLRHTAATLLRKLYGLDAARVVLGHRSAAVTEVYAEMDSEKAAQVMAAVG